MANQLSPPSPPSPLDGTGQPLEELLLWSRQMCHVRQGMHGGPPNWVE